MSYNGWTNRETWLVNLWYNPESIEDVDVIKDVLEEEIEAEFENTLRAIRGE